MSPAVHMVPVLFAGHVERLSPKRFADPKALIRQLIEERGYGRNKTLFLRSDDQGHRSHHLDAKALSNRSCLPVIQHDRAPQFAGQSKSFGLPGVHEHAKRGNQSPVGGDRDLQPIQARSKLLLDGRWNLDRLI